MDKKSISYSAVAVIVASLLVLGGATIMDEDVYYCEDRGLVMHCDKLSTYYGLENGKCWNSEIGNKLCRSGWLLIEKDFEPTPVDYSPDRTGTQYLCSPEGCEKIV